MSVEGLLRNREPSSADADDFPLIAEKTARRLPKISNAILEAPDMSCVSSYSDIDDDSGDGNNRKYQRTLSNAIWRAFKESVTMQELLQASASEVMTVLREHAVKRLGVFDVPVSEVLLAFGNGTMLTRGSQTPREGLFKQKWREEIRKAAENRPRLKKRLDSTRTNELTIQVAAYVVNIKHAASGDDQGLLQTVMFRTRIGATDKDIWDCPCVRAVVEFKWRHWAAEILRVLFFTHLIWLLSYTLYLIIYIETDVTDKNEQYWLKIVAYIADGFALICALPFGLIELHACFSHHLDWEHLLHLFDLFPCGLQVFISYCHFCDIFLDCNRYSALLAVQCVFLFLKLQQFFGTFSVGGSFLDLLCRLLYQVRWFFSFILLTMISMALSFAVLYKHDVEPSDASTSIEAESNSTGQKESDDGANGDFQSVPRALVTVYAVLLGDFETDYVFETSNRTVKGIFFVLFQVVMAITMLNLLIAVMTQAYRTAVQDARVIYNISRARAMEKLEMLLPKRWKKKFDPFVHFLVVEKQKRRRWRSQLTDVMAEPAPFLTLPTDSQDEICQIRDDVQELMSSVKNERKNAPVALENAGSEASTLAFKEQMDQLIQVVEGLKAEIDELKRAQSV